jgi:glyceraldehyde 3-phosphate dehydrogenase
MAIRIGINGFGRIGRQIARIASKQAGFDLVAFNDLGDAATNAHLLKYDSTYGRFEGDIQLEGDKLYLNADAVHLLQEADPAALPWGELGVDIVFECTGRFTTAEQCAVHVAGGAKRVILSAPAKGEMPTYVFGVNHTNWEAEGCPAVVSNASCTTNCLAPLAKVINDSFGIQRGLMNTIHAYTNDQRILDQQHKDLRRARSAAVNVIPTTTGAAKAVALVIPELKGKVDGFAVRVPVVTGSLVDFTCTLQKATTTDELNQAFSAASSGHLSGILKATSDPIVSSDIIQEDHSCVVDLGLTKVLDGTLAKAVAWYDNEWGYSCRCIDLAEYFASVDGRAGGGTAA